jgi:hypothetical protein
VEIHVGLWWCQANDVSIFFGQSTDGTHLFQTVACVMSTFSVITMMVAMAKEGLLLLPW